MKVTFDSNVWRKIASPENFPKEPSSNSFKSIKENINQKKITPFLAETVFTLEAIQRKDRKDFFSDYRAQFNNNVKLNKNGEIQLSISMEPDRSAHPGNSDYLTRHLTDASEVGFKILQLPRIAGIINPDIEEYFFIHQNQKEYLDKAFEVCRNIEKRQAGIFHLKTIGNKYHEKWHRGIECAPDHEEGNIAKAIAEWADGDSVACHIAVNGTYFCTRDVAQKAGDTSVLSRTNIQWLKDEYNFEVISPEDLAIKLT